MLKLLLLPVQPFAPGFGQYRRVFPSSRMSLVTFVEKRAVKGRTTCAEAVVAAQSTARTTRMHTARRRMRRTDAASRHPPAAPLCRSRLPLEHARDSGRGRPSRAMARKDFGEGRGSCPRLQRCQGWHAELAGDLAKPLDHFFV